MPKVYYYSIYLWEEVRHAPQMGLPLSGSTPPSGPVASPPAPAAIPESGHPSASPPPPASWKDEPRQQPAQRPLGGPRPLKSSWPPWRETSRLFLQEAPWEQEQGPQPPLSHLANMSGPLVSARRRGAPGIQTPKTKPLSKGLRGWAQTSRREQWDSE